MRGATVKQNVETPVGEHEPEKYGLRKPGEAQAATLLHALTR
jgi:hypothetical protein